MTPRTSKEKQDALKVAIDWYKNTIGDTQKAEALQQILNAFAPPKLTYRQFYVSVLEGFDRTDQDQGGNWSAADLLDHVGMLLNVGVDDTTDFTAIAKREDELAAIVNTQWCDECHGQVWTVDNEIPGRKLCQTCYNKFCLSYEAGEDSDSEMGANEPDDQPPAGPKEWLKKDIIPPHNAS